MATKRDKLVVELAGLYGNRFADILNALWLKGYPVEQLAQTVAVSEKGTNDATDIIARLLNSGIDQSIIRAAVGTPAPPGTQFAFIDTADKPKIVAHYGAPPPVPMGPPPAPGGVFGGALGAARGALGGTQPAGGPPPPSAYTPAPAPGAGSSPGAGGGGYAGGTATQQATPPPPKATPQQIRAMVQSRYGWAAALADVPEVAKILDDAAQDRISVDEVENRFRATNYYKQTTQAQREWTVFERTSPADAQARRQAQQRRIVAAAGKAGLTNADPGRLSQIANLSIEYGWDDDQINQALASEVHYDPQGAKSGVFAAIDAQVRDWLVPISDRAKEAWASSIVAGTKTPEDFQAYLRDQAKSLFPALGASLDDPNLTTRKYLDPYGQIASKVLGINDTDIDWLDPKWSRFINQVDDKGNRTVMGLADVQRTLMADSQYGYDNTVNGKTEKAGLARGILEQFGFAASGKGFG